MTKSPACATEHHRSQTAPESLITQLCAFPPEVLEAALLLLQATRPPIEAD
jgi:hypothetical protein